MALIVRIDVDRPYGKSPLVRHVLSRISSDAYFPKIESFGYLKELMTMLQILNERQSRAYLFFRRCTLPSESVRQLMDEGNHEAGLHLEDSRSFESFNAEKRNLERHLGRKVLALSKHGSGGAKYGYHHFPPYEPEKYIQWARQASMKVLFGNLEDPTMTSPPATDGLRVYPSAFWLEPYWRDTRRFTVDWLISEGKHRDIVMLVHPENVLQDPNLTADFRRVVEHLECRVLE